MKSTGPLNLKDTVIKLSPEQEKRFAQGPTIRNTRMHIPGTWTRLQAPAQSGRRLGTVASYLEAQLHPDTVKPAGGSMGSATLSKALELSHQIRADAGPTMKIALAWLYVIKNRGLLA